MGNCVVHFSDEEDQLDAFKIDSEMMTPSMTAMSMAGSSRAGLSTAASPQFTSNEDADLGFATVTGFQASTLPASNVHDALEGGHPLDNGSSEMVRPQCITWGGHIFHERCVRKWESELRPRCQKFLDKLTLQILESIGVQDLSKGTVVMLQGLRSQPQMNGTYAAIINYTI